MHQKKPKIIKNNRTSISVNKLWMNFEMYDDYGRYEGIMPTEHDPLINNENSINLVSFSNHINISSEGSTSPQLIHARNRLKREHYNRFDESKHTFCKRRGVSLMFCFALISLILVIVVIFKSQFLTVFGYKDRESQILYQLYEQDWDTLEHVEQQYIPNGWEYSTKCEKSHRFDLTFAVKLQNTDSYVIIYNLFIIYL